MAIFNSYVSLAEGKAYNNHPRLPGFTNLAVYKGWTSAIRLHRRRVFLVVGDWKRATYVDSIVPSLAQFLSAHSKNAIRTSSTEPCGAVPPQQ